MVTKLCCVFVFAVLITYTAAKPPRVRRQESPLNTPRPTASDFNTCIRNCPALPQYNPVCGTNQQTYHNVGRLNCAARCGLAVQVLFGGTCSPAA